VAAGGPRVRVLVLGASGMLGHKLAQRLAPEHEVVGAVRGDPERWRAHPAAAGALRGVRLLGGIEAEREDALVHAFAEARPDVVVNAVGITKQKPDAKEAVRSILVNALLPHRLAMLCRAVDARLVHFSTDCVFSGRRGPSSEDDVPDPVDLYGRSKLLGEVDGPGCLTLRTSIIGRELSGGASLLEWFRRQRGRDARGYTRAIYSGLTTRAMAELVARLIESEPKLEGVWHVASEPIDKFELLRRVNEKLGWGVRLTPDDGFECDRSLDGSRFRARVGWQPPSWDEMIQGLADDPTPYEA